MRVRRYRLTGSVEDNLPLVVGVLVRQLHGTTYDPRVRSLAERIVHVAKVPERHHIGEIAALTTWVRARTRYTKDPYGAELIRHPIRMLEGLARDGYMMMDCEESATMLAGLIGSLGHNARVVLIDANPASRNISHALAQVDHPSESGRWIFLETTRRVPLGWAPPHTREVIVE